MRNPLSRIFLGGLIPMKDMLDKLQTVFAATMKLMYKVFGIFGVTDDGDDTGVKLGDAFKEFAEEIGTVA